MGTPGKLTIVFALCVVFVAVGAVRYKTRPLPFDLGVRRYPSPALGNRGMVAPFPTQILLAKIASFDNELSAYLWFDYLRGRPPLQSHELFLSTSEAGGRSSHEIYLALPNDALTAVPYLSRLEGGGLIDSYEFVFCTPVRLDYLRKQTAIFTATYKKPSRQRLEALSPEQIAPSVARFVLFKSRTDPRTRSADVFRPSSLDPGQANALASDIIAVSKFYGVPLDVFLGIGAMENNYLDVPGDLEHSIWKRRAAKDDIILKRRRRRVLVSNYSVGVWQITRETMRYAHSLYLKDTRDYSQLPERLRPPQELQFDLTNSHVLTTYAGLLLRDLLDRFDGDVSKAVGAYNGGPRNPNPQYAAGVDLVAQYARNILERVNAAQDRATSGSDSVVAVASAESVSHETLPAEDSTAVPESAPSVSQDGASASPSPAGTDPAIEEQAPAGNKIPDSPQPALLPPS